MSYPFQPMKPTVIEDTGRLLPESAYRIIGANLSTGNVDKAVLLANARLMYGKLCEAEAKLMQQNRKLGIFQKAFDSWLPTIRKMRVKLDDQHKCHGCEDYEGCAKSGTPKCK